jgi:hypothetical protein
MISMTVKEKETLEVSINLPDLHFEQRLWINKLKFCKSQIDTLQDNLDSLVKYYFNSELMAEVEQYQNKFIVYRELADRLIKEYKYFRNQISKQMSVQNNGFDLEELISSKKKLEEKTSDYTKYFEELKSNFIHFFTSYYISENHLKAV